MTSKPPMFSGSHERSRYQPGLLSNCLKSCSWSGGVPPDRTTLASGNRTLSYSPVTRSSRLQPRSEMSSPAFWFHAKTAPISVTVPLLRRHWSVPSAPMMRSSLPNQELIADGVMVQKLVQPTSSFSRDIGGKNAPAFTDHSHSVVDTGL